MFDFKNFMNNNSDALMDMSVGLLSGRNAQEQLAMGATGFVNGRKEQRTKNSTLKWLKDNQPEIGALMESGAISAGDAVKMAWQERQALRSAKPDNPFMSVGGQVFNRNTQEWLSPPGGAGGSGSGEMGLQPVWARDENGEYVPLQPSKSGGFVRTQFPDGLTPLGPFGTEFDKKQGGKMGAATGDATVALPGAASLAQTVDENVRSIKDSSSLGSVLGPVDSRTWNVLPGSTAVQARIDQLKGSAFLQARQLLKGGGAITDFEGKKAEAAMARMDQAQSEGDFKAALDDFNSAVQEGYRKLEAQAQAGGNMGGYGSPQTGGTGNNLGKTGSGLTWRAK